MKQSEQYAIGVDIGGSHVSAMSVDLKNRSCIGNAVSVPLDSHACASTIMDSWEKAVRTVMAEASNATFSRIGFAFPGPFDYKRGISLIRGVNKYERIFGLDVEQSLHSRLGSNWKFRYVNDASAFALGECLCGAVAQSQRVMALTLGTGVGSAFVEDHHLVENGPNVPENGWVYNLPFENGVVDEAFSTRWIVNQYEKMTSLCLDNAYQVAQRATQDSAAQELFMLYGKRLARFASVWLKRFDCKTLLLGGNIANAYSLFSKSLFEGLAQANCPACVCLPLLSGNSAMVGAASLFLE